jgi:ubiquinone biosynthesis protein UbiJ
VTTESLVERSLNHLLSQTPGASDSLARHAGACIRFDLAVVRFDARIGEDGYFSAAVFETADATIRPTSALFVRLPFVGREALRLAEYSGDPALLATLDQVFRRLQWDVESDLAPWIGDVAAHRVRALGDHVLNGFNQGAAAVSGNLGEYLVEEAELMARPVDVARFAADVDQLVDAVARAEARVRRLESGAA